MSENKIELKPISELLGMNFFIPSYQRGYRWTKQQVEDLLNDINAFALQKESWYCLQPLVVKKMSDKDLITNELSFENAWYEVVDGQQRITTIRLFIHYFNEMWEGKQKISEPELKYQTRKKSAKFLNTIEIDNETNYAKSEEKENTDNIDFYHISTAYETIHNWVTNNKFKRDVFKDTFQYKTQVIWYEIKDESNPIDTFVRINMGKIPLTNSELIKALFLQKRNFDDRTAEISQLEIAKEWDGIEYSLQNDDFWWFLNKEKNDIPARIEFLFDLMCEIAKKGDKLLEERIGTDKYTTFRFFSEKFINEDVQNIWNDVKDYFLAFEEWFNDTIWYNYIGYLIWSGVSIIDIYDLYKGAPKDVFLDELKNKIKVNLKVNCERITKEDNISYVIDLRFEAKDKVKIREILLLFNIEYIVKQYIETKKTENSELFLRFPFEIYKNGSWDIEHIDSFTENEIKSNETQIEWLESAKLDLDLNQELVDQINLFVRNSSSKKSFEEIKSIIVKEAGEDNNNEDDKNSIGNLTLLDAGTNRGYGNALFPTKRRIIIEKDTKGKFIPICTKNVFLKYFDKKGSSKSEWGKVDMFNYQNHLAEVLTDFLTFKESNNE